MSSAAEWKMAKNARQKLSDDGRTSTDRLLGVIIALLIRQEPDDSASLKQQIETLSNLGLRPSEIASILGRSSTHVNKELTGIRKSRKKG
jgi:hypothetical protein